MISPTEYSSAEQKRAALRDIFGEVLNLDQRTNAPIETEIGFHLYEGLANLIRKMQDAIWQPLHQLWAAAEELRFLFDAHAVWIWVSEEHRAIVAADTTEPIWEVATLTEPEKRLLRPVRDGIYAQDFVRREAPGIRWDVLAKPLGDLTEGAPTNSNLAAVDGVLVIEVAGKSGPPWQFAAFMEHHNPDRRTSRESTRICEAILPAVRGSALSSALELALARLCLPLGWARSVDRDEAAFWLINRVGFQKEAEELQQRPSGFCELYRERFQSIHTILGRVYDQMDELLAAELYLKDAETTLMFSYRSPTDDFICFFPTAEQAASFVQMKEDIEDFLYFWQFRYPRSKAISGWVLATGNSDYTEKFDSDGRWNKWINQCSSEERPRIERQLGLVRKFFKTQEGHEQKFMYLIPIVLRPANGSSEGQGPPRLQPILMASVGSSEPLTRSLRHQLYDLAWQIAPAVEMALLGQMTLEEVYRKEAEVKAVASFSACFAHEIPQPLQLLRSRITTLRQKIGTIKLEPEIEKTFHTDLNETQQCVEEIQDIKDTMLVYVKLRQGKGCQLAPVNVNEVVAEVAERFKLYFEVMREGSTHIKISLDPRVGEIQADKLQLKTMISNLLRNADHILERRTSGEIQVLTNLADKYVEVVVKDNGPGLEKSVIDKLLRGEPHTTKPHGMGLGFTLIRLSCIAHGGSFEIDSTFGLGTSVALRLPDSVE